MDPINRLDQVLQVIGRQMSERASRLDGGIRTQSHTAAAPSARRPTLAMLRIKVQCRLKALDPDDPGHSHKARRVFLESVLAWQFGNELLLDRGFEEIVAGVEEALRANPQIDHRLIQLLRDLSR
jgi:hypothetical protein